LTGEPFSIAAISRAGAKPDVDRIGGQRLLEPRAAAERGSLDLDTVFPEDAGLHADIERHERKRFRHRFADPQQLGGGCRRRESVGGEQCKRHP